MVKNNFGGNKSKGFARKNLARRDTALRVSQEDDEIYAQAVKVMGGSIAVVTDVHGNQLRAHIRGKFRGRGKRDNFIGPGTWLLVGLHSWENNKSSKLTDLRNCDILEVYSETDKNKLKSSITSVDWSSFVANDTKTLNHAEHDDDDEAGIEFTNEATQEYEHLIKLQMNSKQTIEKLDDDAEEENINIDDI